MSAPISPWTDAAERISPDGRYRAFIRDGGEIGMGAPTSGTFVLQENSPDGRILSRIDTCNPSFVWSDKSDAVAVPQWKPKLDQRLLIVSIPRGYIRALPGRFRVLELHSFASGILRGVESPAHEPRPFTFPVTAPTSAPVGLVVAWTLAWLWGILLTLSSLALVIPGVSRYGLVDASAAVSALIAVLGLALCYAGEALRKRRRVAGFITLPIAMVLMVLPSLVDVPITLVGGFVAFAIAGLTMAHWHHLSRV